MICRPKHINKQTHSKTNKKTNKHLGYGLDSAQKWSPIKKNRQNQSFLALRTTHISISIQTSHTRTVIIPPSPLFKAPDSMNYKAIIEKVHFEVI